MYKNIMNKISVLMLFIILISTLSSCRFTTPHPQIKSGEFNFSVTYEYAGETKTVSGVYVCQFAGVDWAIDIGFHREWSGYIKGGIIEETTILGIADDGGVVELNLYFDPDHFMGDSYSEGDEPFIPWMSVKIVDDGMYFENNAEFIAETYGARIICYEYDDPIQNYFN